MVDRPSGIPVLSLFCGCGGMDLNFEQAGFNPVLAIDIDQAAVETHGLNRAKRPNSAIRADLAHVPPNEIASRLQKPVRGVIGGPPCQAFSASNVYKHPEDPRSQLPINYARIVKRLNLHGELDFFVFENVFGLRTSRHAEQLALFKALFGDAGFTLFEDELNAVDFEVPQHRRRVFIVGFNSERYGGIEFEFPTGNPDRRVTLREAIEDLPEPVFFERGLSAAEIKEQTGYWNHWSLRPKSPKFANQNGELVPGDRRGRAFRVLHWDKPSMTVAYGHREVHVHPNMHRRLSVREALRLQGFPDDYQLSGNLSDQIRMVSDAVPPPLARALGEQIRSYLKR